MSKRAHRPLGLALALFSSFGASPFLQAAYADCQGNYRDVQPSYAGIEHDLFLGKIESIRNFSKDSNNHGLYLVQIRSSEPGKPPVEAFFKPRLYGDEDGWSRSPMEYMGYFLNRKLGMDYVPPVAYRRGLKLQVDGQTFSEGAFILRSPNFESLHAQPLAHFPHDHDGIVSDHRVLNVLLQNQDGHSKNLGLGQHWGDGKNRPVFIDFGASLRKGTNVSMAHYPAYENSDVVEKVRKQTYESLKNLRHDMFHDLIRDHIVEDWEVWQMLGRRDEIIRYFDHLVQQRGAAAVFL